MRLRTLPRFLQRCAFVGIVFASLTVVSFFLLNILRWSAEPTFGYLVRTTAQAPTVGLVLGAGADVGLKVGDRILAVNGRSVSSLSEIRELRQQAIGATNAYVLKRGDQRLELTIPTQPRGLRDALVIFGLPWAVGIAFIGLGIVVFWMKGGGRPAWAFLLFSVVAGIFVLFIYRSVLHPSWLNTVSMGALAFLPAVMLHLGLTFPGEGFRASRHHLWILTPYFGSLGLLLLLRRSSPIWEDIPLLLKGLWLAYLSLAVGLLLAATVYTHRTTTSSIVRMRARVILLGFAVATLVPVAESLLNAVFDVYLLPHTTWLLPFFIAVPLSVGYAIVKHNLFDIDTVIRRTTGYLLLTGVIALLYTGLLSVFNLLFRRWAIGRSPIIPLLLTLIFVFLFNPLRARAQRLVDRIFHRTQSDYRQTVRAITEALTSVIALDVVVDRVLETLTHEMFIATAAVLLAREGRGGFRVYRVEGEQAEDLREVVLDEQNPLVVFLRREKIDLLTRYAVAEAPRYVAHRQEYLRELDRLHAVVVIPLIFTGELIGFVALGEKMSGRSYTAEDAALLRTLASESAIAINNATAFKKLQDLRATLEQRVEERTTDLAVLNRKLEESNDRLRELDRQKSDFVSDVSHELRTPLTSIKGFVDYLLEGMAGELNAAQKASLTRVHSNAERLTRLINDLLDLARIEAGRVELHLARVAVEDVATAVLDELRPLASDKRVDLDAEVASKNVLVRADRDKLHQILLNLIHNAVKFTPPGGRVRVAIAGRDDGTVATTVRDTGHGIPAEELDRVFEKFYQVGDAEGAQKGSGLGLTITQKLIELQGGTIWVESELDKGTTFGFTLPATKEEP
jgi:signal transduction histidine kinase